MTKKYARTAVFYAVLALISGVFYREFTKGMGYTGHTSLSLMHVHYFMLGMTFFLILSLLEKSFAFTDKTVERLEIVYNAALNVACLAFLLRGLAQVVAKNNLSSGLDAAISGIAGAGHIALGVSLVWLLIKVVKGIKDGKRQ